MHAAYTSSREGLVIELAVSASTASEAQLSSVLDTVVEGIIDERARGGLTLHRHRGQRA